MTDDGQRLRRSKIANAIAEAIEREIVSGKYPIGSPIGNEAELCARYGVSRWAIREAVAIVQNDGLITVKRGRGGGALINSTPQDSLAAAICGFLLHARLSNEQIIRGRLAIDSLLYRTAAASIGKPLSAKARALLQGDKSGRDPRAVASDILGEIIDLAGNPLVGVFALALSKLTLCRLVMAGFPDEDDDGRVLGRQLLALRERQLRAVVAVDADDAIAAEREMAQSWLSLFASRRPRDGGDLDQRRAVATSISDVLHPGRSVQPASIVSTLLMLDAMQLPPAAEGYIGSEATLTARYCVPRNLLREGVRILERNGFVRSEPGRSGGLRASEPDMSPLIERAARVFAFCGVTQEQEIAFARQIRLHAVDAVFARPDGPAELADALSEGLSREWPAAELFACIARHSDDCLVILANAICEGETQKHLLDNLITALYSRERAISRRIIAHIMDLDAGQR